MPTRAQGVVMPERANASHGSHDHQSGWNACLDEVARLNAVPVRQVIVPDGWKLVPVEPTPEMVCAAEEAHMPFGDMDIALRMAILSAPSAPATVQGVNQQLLEVLEELRDAANESMNATTRQHQIDHFAGLIAKADALLSAPSPAGVDGLEVECAATYVSEFMRAVPSGLVPLLDRDQLCRLSDAQAIIDGLRGEADQQAQRIGELASHLEFAVTMLTVAGLAGNAQVEAMRAALSAGVGRVK